MTSLYERLGGKKAIDAVVDRFYDLMIKDPKINQYYNNIDLLKLRCRQKQFITMVTGGPHNYEGTDMKTAHCKLNISKSEFDITWSHLEQSLLYFKVEKPLIEELKLIFYSVEKQIVKTGSSSVQMVTTEMTECPFRSKQNNSSIKKEGQCPFKSKKIQSSIKKGNDEEQGILKLSNQVYLKWSY